MAPFRFFHRSNLATYLSLAFGLMAAETVRLSGSHDAAGLCITVAALLDTVDGRFARLFRRTDKERLFGIQIDSLVDAVNFGAVPVVLATLLMPAAAHSADQWAMRAIEFFYVLCVLTRLGYYNVHEEQGRKTFIGLPTTMMGLLWGAALILEPSRGFLGGVMLWGGIAMISPIQIPRPKGGAFAAMLAIGLGIALLHLIRLF